MKTDFIISCDNWIADAGSSAESATLTSLEIKACGRVITRLEDIAAKTTRNGPWASAYLMASWLADNWWRIRCEPVAPERGLDWRMSHQLGAVGGGYVWPNLTLASDGVAIEIHSIQTDGSEVEPIRYLDNCMCQVMAEDFEAGVDVFVEEVIARLVGSRAGGEDLRQLWKEIRTERYDNDLRQERSLEALLGHDRHTAPAGLLEEIRSQDAVFGRHAVEEIAASYPDKVPEILEALSNGTANQAEQVNIPEFEPLRARIGRETSGLKLPWQKAEKSAEIARMVWALDPERVSDDKLSDVFGVNREFIRSGNGVPAPLAVGYRGEDRGIIKVVLKKRRNEARRFMLARLVADHLYAEDTDQLLPATNVRTARQKFQRAFAHEFLCPYSKLLEFIGGRSLTEDVLEEAAEHFVVSPLLITNKLVDKGALPRDALPDY